MSTSRSLLGRARDGDATAWGRLSHLYAPLVFHWCRRPGLDEADIADVVQEVFQAVATNLGPFRKSERGGSFRGWLRTITENKLRDRYRRKSREIEAEGGTEAQRRLAGHPAPPDPGSGELPEELDAQFLRRVLDVVRAEFEEKTWQAFWRTTVAGRSAREVGAELSLSPGAVRVAKSRVLKRLRDELGAFDP